MIWKEILAALVRHLLGFAVAWLVAKGVIDEALGGKILVEGTASLVGLLVSALALGVPIYLSIREKIRKRILMLTALQLHGGADEETAKLIADHRPASTAF
jgi:hypothetical protein